ncbi:MAG: indole-3-glycerol-phosphate synthase [Nitrososphaerota archaeon]|nr:indole-3-glycerol-phosphate synthase [Nitrososphaerota archaeon]
MSRDTNDFLRILCEDARRRVAEGYYRVAQSCLGLKPESLRSAILRCDGNAVIAEFKRASPSLGAINSSASPRAVVKAMERGGACGLSVLTARERFGGSLEDLREARAFSRLPILMKDIVVSEEQIRAAHELGAQSILLILRAFKRRYTGVDLRRALRLARDYSLEVLLEACGREELLEALETEADLLGVNSRDLSSLVVDKRVHEEAVRGVEVDDRVLVAESGIEGAEDVRKLKRLGYRAFLVGTSIMRSDDVEAVVRELVEA